MDLSNSLNLNTASQQPLFNPTYLNLGYIFNKILEFLGNVFGFGANSGSGAGFGMALFFRLFLFLVILFFIFMICYCLVRLFELRKKEKEYLEHEISEYAKKHSEQSAKAGAEEGTINPKWQAVMEHLFSQSEGDWKLAIIEADVMLESLMDQLGYKGENLGEKLKSVDKAQFRNLNSAWEAHNIRNKIAHEGLAFELPQREAKRVIALYEQVFHEFAYI